MENNDWEVKEKKRRISIWMISTIVIALLLIISVFTNGFGIRGITGKATVSSVEEQVKAYIEENLVQPGTEVKVGDAVEENGLYKLSIEIMGQEFDSYVTKDGKLLFPSVIDMTEEIPQLDQSAEVEEDWTVFENKLPVNIKSKILAFEEGVSSTYDEEILEYKNYELIPKTLIVFYSPGCGWCTRYYPVLIEAQEKYPEITIYAFDLRSNSEIADKYGITGTPGNVINGKYKVSGYKSIEDLSEILDKLN